MKWIFLILLALFVFLIFRRMNREQRISGGETNWQANDESSIVLQHEGLPDHFSGRAPMSLEEFYSRYYAEKGFDRDYVEKVVTYIAKAGGVPASQIRPEDQLDDFPHKGLRRGMHLLEMLLGGKLTTAVEQDGVSPEQLRFETVDEVIRNLEPHKGSIAAYLQSH